MFARLIEINARSGKASELVRTINEKILPVLKKQNGFVDETILTSDTEPNRIIGLGLWNSQEDAERYQREQYPKINAILAPLLENAPVIRTFKVLTSTTHRIAAGRTAA